ncbi:MAG: DUF4405 domain-containing protein [Deltaproteobacteria bacterium]|nr:DUF4405 domain-containing protein [Deltaproteobacteria bacterium]
MTDKKKIFNWRGWVTFVVIISFIIDTISGIILYFAPHGRIANWTIWTIWGLDKDQWAAIHTIFGYVLLIIVGIHLYFNWRIFIHFLWSKIQKAIHLRWEIITAILLNLFIFAATIWEIPPFSTTMNLGDRLKGSWEEEVTAPAPVSQAQDLTIQELASTIQVPVEQILSSLRSRGIEIQDVRKTLGEIAKEHDTSPEKLYDMMKQEGVSPNVPQDIERSGSGMGRKTIEKISSEKGIPLDEALDRLRQNGIDAKASDMLKDISVKYGISSNDIYNRIESGN